MKIMKHFWYLLLLLSISLPGMHSRRVVFYSRRLKGIQIPPKAGYPKPEKSKELCTLQKKLNSNQTKLETFAHLANFWEQEALCCTFEGCRYNCKKTKLRSCFATYDRILDAADLLHEDNKCLTQEIQHKKEFRGS